jgi:hypothetical protein
MKLQTLALLIVLSGTTAAQQKAGGKDAGGPGEFHGELGTSRAS